MKILIEIPDKYKIGLETGITVMGSSASIAILEAVKNGTEIHEGETLPRDCEHCSKTYGTLGCCDMAGNRWIYSCEKGQREWLTDKVKKEQREILHEIRTEIEEATRCPYGKCVGTDNCQFQDCMIHGQHVIDIIDRCAKKKPD